MNLERLKEMVKIYLEYIKTEEYKIKNKERMKNKEYFKKITKDKFDEMNEEKLKEYISKMWATESAKLNKEKIFTENSGYENVRNTISKLLYDEDEDIIERWNNCEIKYFKEGYKSELLTKCYPEKYALCNSKSINGITKITNEIKKNDEINGENYKKFCDECIKIVDEIKNIMTEDEKRELISRSGYTEINLEMLDEIFYYVPNNIYANILEILKKNSGKKYYGEKNPKRTEGMHELAEECKNAAEKFGELADKVNEKIGLEKCGTNDWLDQSRNKIRNYLWIQLKLPDKKEKPESISLFAEYREPEKVCRYRVSLEIKNDEVNENEKNIYYKFLDKSLEKDKGLAYYIETPDNKSKITAELNDEVKHKLESGEYKKVEISKILEYDKNLTDEECIESMEKGIAAIMDYYKYIFEGEDTMKKENSIKEKFGKNIILYGPPGTGKTYNSAKYAVAICNIGDGKDINELENYDEVMELYKKLENEGKIVFTTFHQSYGYEEFIEGIKPILEGEQKDEQSKEILYKRVDGVFKNICNNARKDENKNKNFVLIIDEINRGNISKIFGELITLIEDKKREGQKEEKKVILPYSKTEFSVPNNVYIIGTMNTADRSIAIMDTALRRRFDFIEQMPDMEILKEIKIKDSENTLNVSEMLEKINKRIEILYDREHTIGHAYFMKLKDNPTLEELSNIFEKSIIPLLQEYFYDDYEKIQLILGDKAKTDDRFKFIKDEEIKIDEYFKNIEDDTSIPEKRYTIQKEALTHIESYIEIYKQEG